MLPQLPDVPVVHVHVDETAQSSVVCKEVPPQGGVLAGQPLQQFAHAGGVELDRVPPPREGAERRGDQDRSEEHTSELQSPCNLVCRLLLEKKKKKKKEQLERKLCREC